MLNHFVKVDTLFETENLYKSNFLNISFDTLNRHSFGIGPITSIFFSNSVSKRRFCNLLAYNKKET